MNNDNTHRNSIDRRAFLRTSSVAAAGLAGLPATSARSKSTPTTEDYLELSELCKQAGWDVHQWRRQLANRGFEFKYQDVKLSTPLPSDEPSTEKLDKGETWLYMTYTNGSPDWVKFEWSLNDGWDDSGASPLDYAAIAFDGRYYDRSDYGPKYGKYVTAIGERSDDTASTGVVVEYDEDHHALNTTGRFGSWFELALNPESGTSNTNRTVKVDYWHTWNWVGLNDITIPYDGDVTLDFNSGDWWHRQTSAVESEMDYGDTHTDK